MYQTTKVRLGQALLALVFLTVWELAGRLSLRANFLLARPSAVVSSLVDMAADGTLFTGMATTAWEAFAGLVIGTTIGSFLGLSLWLSSVAKTLVRPFILIVSTLPVFAIAPLLIVWFGIGIEMKIAMATLATVFVAFNQGLRGTESVSGEFVETMLGFGASRRQIFRKVVVPGAFDWVLSSMRLNVGFSLLGAFIGEFVAADRGLGYEVLKASGLYNVPRALAAAGGLVFLAVVLDQGAAWVERRRSRVVQLLTVPSVIWKSNA